MTLSITAYLRYSAEITLNTEHHNAKCRVIFIAMLDVILLSVIRENVILLKCLGGEKADPHLCAATWRQKLAAELKPIIRCLVLLHNKQNFLFEKQASWLNATRLKYATVRSSEIEKKSRA